MTADSISTFDVLIEIPKGSRNKYEYDFKLKKIRYDRMIFSSMMEINAKTKNYRRR